MERARARELFASSAAARLATADRDGRPHLVPITFAVIGDVVVTAVDHKPKSTRSLKRLRNIAENPRVTLLVDHYEDDWSRLWWVRADGEAEVGRAVDAPGSVAALTAKYEQYRSHPPDGDLITIRVLRWTGWSAS